MRAISKYLLTLLCSVHSALSLAEESYAPWLTQIGLTDNIASAAKWGKNIKLGVVDTGIDASSSFFTAGQVSKKLSSCAALTFSCSNGFYDDHGHGTAVASIAAGSKIFQSESNYGGYSVTANSIMSVAPSANIIAQKVLNASGSGYSTDVANGIIKAANAGASVINVSITYLNSQDIVSSINYAASKGAYIVWAGGNSNANLLSNVDTSGLSDAALNRLVFAGSVNASNERSSFSNTPGSGNLNASSSSTSYAQRWLMAPGENILAAYNPSYPDAWGYWSGTSMSAPILSGSLVLLQATWPILKTSATAIQLLTETATDLGDAGVDEVYGSGLINLTKAFQPVGELTVKSAQNQTLLVDDLTGTLLTSGALGKLSKIKSKLANYTAFDDYQRNFKVNLSGLIQSNASAATLNPLTTSTRTKAKKIKLTDGSTLTALTSTPASDVDHLGEFGYNSAVENQHQPLYIAFDSKDGSAFSIGNHYATQYAYASVFFNNQNFSELSSALASQTFSQLAENGRMFNYATQLSENLRLALAWNDQRSQDVSTNNIFDTNTTLFKTGLNYQYSDNIEAGFSLSLLNEKNGLLGSQMSENSALGFNANNKSVGLDFSLGIQLDQRSTLLIEKGFSMTKSADGNGLISKTSDLYAQSFGMSFIRQQVFTQDDALKISIKQPLSITAGRASMVTASVDDQGYAVYNNESIDISPSGKETHFMLSYEKNLTPTELVRFETTYSKDLFNVQGDHGANVNLYYQINY